MVVGSGFVEWTGSMDAVVDGSTAATAAVAAIVVVVVVVGGGGGTAARDQIPHTHSTPQTTERTHIETPIHARKTSRKNDTFEPTEHARPRKFTNFAVTML